MASFHSSNTFACLVLVLLFYAQSTFGDITCESLNHGMCAFVVSLSGIRCVLEKRIRRGGLEEFSCCTSDIEIENLKGWVETDECGKACGLTRITVGISLDSLLEPRFAQKLCSPRCYQECPNIDDLYFNLAAGEVCSSQGYVRHRVLVDTWQRSGAPMLPLRFDADNIQGVDERIHVTYEIDNAVVDFKIDNCIVDLSRLKPS